MTTTEQVAHVRRPAPRRMFTARAAEYGQHGTGYNLRAGPAPATYCGAEPTTRDWDRRSATAKKNAVMADREVCPACLTAARGEVAGR